MMPVMVHLKGFVIPEIHLPAPHIYRLSSDNIGAGKYKEVCLQKWAKY